MNGMILDENKIVQAVMEALKNNGGIIENEALKGGNREETETISDSEIVDITAIPENEICLVDEPKNKEALMRMKRLTPARTATGRTGDREKTLTVFRKKAGHAGASDAVRAEADTCFAEENNIPVIQSMPANKDEYLMRPDLGTKLDEEALQVVRSQLKKNPDIQIVIGEGQSNEAIKNGLHELFPPLLQGLKANGIDYGTPVFVKYTRVGVGDLICKEVGAKAVCVILGERPGMITWDCISVYMTYGAEPGISENSRTVISNINNDGVPYSEAGAYAAELIKKILEEKKSGSNLVI